MSAQENKAIVQKFYEAGNAGDMETCFGLLADDIVWTNIGSTSVSGTYRGKPQLMEGLLGPLFAQLKGGIHMTVERMVAEGDYVVAQTRGAAETLDGVPYENTYCWVIRLRDGQFVELTEYLDTALVAAVFDRD
jgi:ketosteroid isomerase-like protein